MIKFALFLIELKSTIILKYFDSNQYFPARIFNVSTWKVFTVLKEAGLYPFHIQKVQELLPGDRKKRRKFCRWLIAKCRRDPNFLRRVMWTDECKFTRLGVYNCHNEHIYAPIDQNPHATKASNFQVSSN